MLKRKTQLITLKSGKPAKSGSLVCDIRALIEQAREHVSRSVNGTLVALYWQIGKRVREEVLHGKRAEYGERIISTLSKQLTWSHFVEILPLRDQLKKDFYAEGNLNWMRSTQRSGR